MHHNAYSKIVLFTIFNYPDTQKFINELRKLFIDSANQGVTQDDTTKKVQFLIALPSSLIFYNS